MIQSELRWVDEISFCSLHFEVSNDTRHGLIGPELTVWQLSESEEKFREIGEKLVNFPRAAKSSILIQSSRDGHRWKAESVGYKSLFHQPISIPTASPVRIHINIFSQILLNFTSFSGSCQIVNFGPIKSWRVSLETSKCRLQKLISSTHLNSDWITPQNWNFQFFP